jgi:hypothetical protein
MGEKEKWRRSVDEVRRPYWKPSREIENRAQNVALPTQPYYKTPMGILESEAFTQKRLYGM